MGKMALEDAGAEYSNFKSIYSELTKIKHFKNKKIFIIDQSFFTLQLLYMQNKLSGIINK